MDGIDLTVNLAPGNVNGLWLINPVMIASGTFGWDGFGSGIPSKLEFNKLGGIVVKTTTPSKRTGNPTPRIVHGNGWTLNSIGLENPGIFDVLENYAPTWGSWKVPVLLSLAGERLSEFEALAKQTNGINGISGLELNVSCPNVDGGLEFGQSPELVFQVTQLVKSVTSLPVIVKLSPNVTDITVMVIAASEGGADAVALTNTLKGMAIDPLRQSSRLGTVMGGISGNALRPISLAMVYAARKVTTIPIIGVGGISNATHALEFLLAGASAIQVGSANFVDPYAPSAATNYFTVGYKGSSAYDAGLFYCPYVPLQMVRAVGENSFQPKIGFKTRYGLVSNPFANETGSANNGAGDGSLTANANRYYRHVIVANLM